MIEEKNKTDAEIIAEIHKEEKQGTIMVLSAVAALAFAAIFLPNKNKETAVEETPQNTCVSDDTISRSGFEKSRIVLPTCKP